MGGRQGVHWAVLSINSCATTRAAAMMRWDLDFPESTKLTDPCETPSSRASPFMRLFVFRTFFICARVKFSGIVLFS